MPYLIPAPEKRRFLAAKAFAAVQNLRAQAQAERRAGREIREAARLMSRAHRAAIVGESLACLGIALVYASLLFGYGFAW